MKVLILILCAECILTFNFNLEAVKEINVSRAYGNDTYFGYSVLLQIGTTPMIIVGATKLSPDGGGVFACTLNGDCKKYDLVKSYAYTYFTGSFLGMSLDGSDEVGGPFIVCAPRKVQTVQDNNFLKGYCFYKHNSSTLGPASIVVDPLRNEAPIGGNSRRYYYDYGFAEAGLDVHLLEHNQVMLGAPGVKNWNGAIVVHYLAGPKHAVIPKKSDYVIEENDSYFGYSVTSANILVDGQIKTVFVAGAPRGGDLDGIVRIYDGYNLLRTFSGEEVGSYFGSTVLAVDTNNDGIDELFIGAPLGAGTAYDEGYVYLYISSENSSYVKLTGSRRAGARFGTSMSSLGDIDLDGYKDIAVSAPYEDNGVGAVYVYKGSANGIESVHSQRLSPLNFKGNFGNVRGFGLGISKGNDIDGNGHNDVAVGAYKSGQVFLIKTRKIVDLSLRLKANVSSITHDPIDIEYCIYYTQRSPIEDHQVLNVKVNLHLDYRVEQRKDYEYIWEINRQKIPYCENVTVTVGPSMVDIQPLRIVFTAATINNDVIAVSDNKIEKFIPVSHGCGEDNICQTDITLEVSSSKNKLILGLDKVVTVNIFAETNNGEPGYQCQLYMDLPSELDYRDKESCKNGNGTLICPFAFRLLTSKNVNVQFDIVDVKPDKKEFGAQFEVKCLGENRAPNKQKLTWNVVLNNSPYIEGKSEPENIYFGGDESVDQDMTHVFTLGNFGPSPVKLDVRFLMSVVRYKEENIFKISNAQGQLSGNQIPCVQKTSYEIERTNDTITDVCFKEGSECMEIVCNGGYLYKSSETASFSIQFKVNLKLLESKYEDEKIDVFVFSSSAFTFNSTSRIEGYASTRIYSAKKPSVPIWIYILGAVIGCGLLLLVIYLLYKCHFFERRYKEKLNDERLMDENLETKSGEDNLNEIYDNHMD